MVVVFANMKAQPSLAGVGTCADLGITKFNNNKIFNNEVFADI